MSNDKQVKNPSLICVATFVFSLTITISAFGQSKNQDQDLKKEIEKTLSKAADHYGSLAVNGGYVYYYSLDNKRRLGEGVATRTG